MYLGTVKVFSEVKGIGYIKVADENREILIHVVDLVDQIRQDDWVTFDIVDGKKGLIVVNVKKAF